ncbi:MFS transporter [Kitasatospora sp. CM 4170]|uniref:MFS transporter n=1 Tax=Kitasatospora aburaviensis TaxID=67265 RepID=A0ABW1ES02_9ACTN|nr:MFS transporter [Kitasatospora sp. CM 4170]WNM48473.1 MFS transporter [Kitasatospora sp. CM 4170]
MSAQQPPAAGGPSAGGPGAGPGRTEDRWSLVVAAGLLSFVAMLDMNVVNLALTDIADGLHVSATTAQWAVLGYQLPLVALLLPAGRWLDRVGTRSALLLAVGCFALCSVLAAAAPWAGWLIAARLAQGAFGAVLFVLMPVLAATAVRPELRGRAMSVPATLGPLGAVTGPVVGGLLLDHVGWRAVFLVKLPVCLVALAITYRAAPRDGGLRAPARGPAPGGSTRGSLGDAALIGSAVAAVLLGLTLAPGAPAWLLLALPAAPLVVVWLRRPGGRPVSTVLRASGTAAVNGSVLALAAGFAANHYLLAQHLRRDGGISATTTALTMLAFPLGMVLAGRFGGRLADRWGARPTALTGACVTALGLLLLVPIGADWTPADISWRLALAGAGMGLNGGPVQALVMTAAPPGQLATAGSVVQLSRSLGFALGPALATAAGAFGEDHATGVRAGIGLATLAAVTAVGLLVLHHRTHRTARVEQSGRTGQAAPAARTCPAEDAAPVGADRTAEPHN